MGNIIERKIFRWILNGGEKYEPIPRESKSQGFKGNHGKHYIFLPAYVVMEVREFSSLSVMEQIVHFHGKLRIRLPKVPQEVQQELQEKLKIALFNRNKFETLTKENAKCKVGDDESITWTYEIDRDVSWTPYLALIPFDSHNLPVSVELARFKHGKGRYYFNTLNLDDKHKKEYFLPRQISVRNLEDFNLYYYQVRYEPVEDSVGRRRVEYSPQITLYFRLTRSVWNSFVTILLPNFILQLLSIILFFTENNFESRVVNITVLILAIVAFLPPVRAGFPNIPYATLLDYIIYTSVVNLGLCMLETSLKRHDPDYDSRVWLIIACSLVFVTTLVSGLCIFYRVIEYFWMFKKIVDRKRLTERKIQKALSQKSLKDLGSMSAADLARVGSEAAAAIAIDTVVQNNDAGIPDVQRTDSRQSQEIVQRPAAVQPKRDESLTCTEQRYVQREIQLRGEKIEKLKSI